MNRKLYIREIVLTLFLLTAVVFCFSGCKERYPKNVGIYTIEVLSCTGNKENNNCVTLVNDYGKTFYTKSNYDLLTSEAAIKLKEEVIGLPDVLGNEDEPYAYSIWLQYYDDDLNLVKVEKHGYGAFPDNWSSIIEHTNEISYLDQKLTDSTDIVVINGDLLKRDFGATDDMLPEGVTLDKYLEDTGLTYIDLYIRSFYLKGSISDYKYDYYGIKSHRITEDTVAAPSDNKALKEYAEANLESIKSDDGISITGLFQNYRLEIVRFDSFEEWKEINKIGGMQATDDQTIDINYSVDLHMDFGMTGTVHQYVYVDPTKRFLIITTCYDYDVINAYFNQ